MNTNPLSVSTIYITARQLHERWNLHPESIRRNIREGKIPAIRMGKRLRIPLAEIEAIEAANRVIRGRKATP